MAQGRSPLMLDHRTFPLALTLAGMVLIVAGLMGLAA